MEISEYTLQRIERLATEFMGWRESTGEEWNKGWYNPNGEHVTSLEWNPFTSHDDVQLLLDKCKRSRLLLDRIIGVLRGNTSPRLWRGCTVKKVFMSTPEEKTEAVETVVFPKIKRGRNGD